MSSKTAQQNEVVRPFFGSMSNIATIHKISEEKSDTAGFVKNFDAF
ncbi:MAG: hypothetical protein RSD64_02590 [Christensenellaceae bacterium]